MTTTTRPIDANELATMLGVNVRTIQRWVRNRTIPCLRVGGANGRIRFLPSQVDEIISAYTQHAQEARPEADIPNDRYSPHMVVVPMRRPNDAA